MEGHHMGNSVTRFFFERDFFRLSLAQDRKKSRVAVKNPTTDLWGHGYSEFVHCPLLMKIASISLLLCSHTRIFLFVCNFFHPSPVRCNHLFDLNKCVSSHKLLGA